jgi:hypothetical protein
MASTKQWVVVKQGKFATVNGGLGARPKVYPTAQAAQFDIDSKPMLKGGSVRPYVDPDKVAAAPTPTPMATTSKEKAKTGANPVKPKKAATGMP